MRHVMFDIGGVLIDYDFARLARALARGNGGDEARLLPLFGKDAVIEVETGRQDPEENVEGAQAAGLQALQFTNERIPEIRKTLGLARGAPATP